MLLLVQANFHLNVMHSNNRVFVVYPNFHLISIKSSFRLSFPFLTVGRVVISLP